MDESDPKNPNNHPGSRSGQADPNRPDLGSEVPRLGKADVRPEMVPDNLPGSLPENAGRDPGDVHRDPADKRPRRR